MSNFVIILGKTGSGKSTSIKTLNPAETYIISTLDKRLPFQNSMKMYNKEAKNRIVSGSWDQTLKLLEGINTKTVKIKNIVIDDAVYIMRNEFFERCKETGYQKYNDLADHFRTIIATCSQMRDDLNIFMMLHTDTEESEGNIIGYKSASVGKLLDKLYNPLESAAIVLFCQPRFDDKGVPEFGFYTHKQIVNRIEYPSKSPEGMFKEDFIPNDLQLVVKTMTEYYG